LSEIIDEYDPKHHGKRKGERFDACFLILGYIDDRAVRLRASEEGRVAIKSLERSIQRMRAAGFAQKESWEWKRARLELTEYCLQGAQGVGRSDQAIWETFRLQYNLVLTDPELLEFSNFLVAHYPDYPSWSEKDLIKDYSRTNDAGYPFQRHVMKKPDRFYEAYSEFTKTRQP
jgi:hypothetical protein